MVEFDLVKASVYLPDGQVIVGRPIARIDSDGFTCWVNSAGYCIGRFGRMGIDIHRPPTEQARSECLFCTHERPDRAAWETFKAEMKRHYAIDVGDEHMPTRLREAP